LTVDPTYMRRSAAVRACLAILLLVAGCSQPPSHAPVSARVLRKLEKRSISKSDFIQRLSTVDAGVRAGLPAQAVTLPFEFRSNTPVIKAFGADGRPVAMLLDTGAARMVLSSRSALALGVSTIRSDEAKATLLGVVGQEEGLVGMVSPLRLGDWHVPAYPCFVRTYETSGGGVLYPDNILGFDLLSRYCTYLTLDYSGRQATFGFGRAFLAKNGPGAQSAPFRLKDGVASIELASRGVKWSCILDSGSFNGVEISERVAGRLGVQDQGEVVQGLMLVAVGGAVTSDHVRLRTVKLPELTLLGGKYQEVEVDISPGLPRVGSFFLKDYKVTFDFRRMRVWLER
jgi:hypothetical protein